MRRAPLLVLFLLIAFVPGLTGQPPLRSPAWEAKAELDGVDLSGLTPDRKPAALKVLRETDCTCGCAMKVAQCRVEDPACTYSKGIAGLIVKGFLDGKSPEDVKKQVASSALGKPRPVQKILGDAIEIPTAGAPSAGPANAKIVLVEFSDFECPYCAQAAMQVREVMKAYPNDVRLVYKQFPLSMHTHAEMAARAALAAQEQGKFWEMHDRMFANFRQLNRDNLLAWAKQLGMDEGKFETALNSPKNTAAVEKDLQDGQFAGVNGTPSFFINGKHFNGPMQLAVLKPILDEELKKARK